MANDEPNPNPVGRPPTQEADPELLSPTEKRAAAMGSGEDAGLIWAAKRMRPAYSDGAAAERSPLQYVTVAEAEVRTAIKVAYVKTLGAPPAREWRGSDGTINFIKNELVKGVGYGTVEDQLCRIMAAEENKMDVDVGVRCYAGTGVHNRRQQVGC